MRVSGATVPQVLRALASLRGFAAEGREPNSYGQAPRFDTLGLMYDCSRNGVPKVETVKLFLRRLALMGMNFFMLYTEDTYEVPGVPHLGYLRGLMERGSTIGMDRFGLEHFLPTAKRVEVIARLRRGLRAAHGALPRRQLLE